MKSLLALSKEFKIGLTTEDINSILILSEKEISSIKHVPKELFNYYKTELIIKKILIKYANTKLNERDKMELFKLSQSTIRINLRIAKDINNETLIDCLHCLQNIAVGSNLSHGDFTTKLYEVFKFNE